MNFRDGDTDSIVSAIVMGQRLERPSIFGRIRKWSNLKNLEKCLLYFGFISILASLCFSVVSIIYGDLEEEVFAVVVVVIEIFVIYYLLHGVFGESFYELLSLTMSLGLLCILFVINYFVEVKRHLGGFHFVSVVVSVVFALISTIIGIFQAWKYNSSPKLFFRVVGADMKKQQMYRRLLLAQNLLAFDSQWTTVCFILVFYRGFQFATGGEILCAVFGPIFLAVWALLGYFNMRLEHKWLTWLFGVIGLFLQPTYILYLFVRAWTNIYSKLDLLNLTLYISGGVCLLSHLSLLATVICVSFNYGKGLAKEVYGDRTEDSQLFSNEVPNALWPDDCEQPVEENTANESQPLLFHLRTVNRLVSPVSGSSYYCSVYK